MAGDWIKMHRSLLGHWVFADDATFYLWTNLLLRANWKEGKFWPGGSAAPVTVQRGQILTGRNALHKALYPSHDAEGRRIKRESPPPHPTTLWRWLEAMEKDGMVRLDVRNAFTVVTICNYDTYQNQNEDDAQVTRKRRARRAQPVRNPCAGDAQGVRTIEEETKKVEEGKNGVPHIGFSHAFQMAWDCWPAAKRIKKETSEAAWRAATARIAFRFEGSESKAEDWLSARVRQYAKSPIAGCKYCQSIANWLVSGSYDDPVEAWNQTDSAEATRSLAPTLEELKPF